MLLDEPFNKLDAALRQSMRNFVFEHIAARRIPCLMVTHDLADVPANGRLLLLKDGAVTHA
jgi:putative thiamine transport system ATP-binding protein